MTASPADSVKAFIAGGFGGVCAVLVGMYESLLSGFKTLTRNTGHPFDLTKTRLQTAPPGTYTGAVDVVKKTLARDGLSGYFFITYKRERNIR